MKPKSSYRLAAESTEMRDRLIVAAERIMQAEGISSLTVGRLAKEFDLKRPTIHYYIGTIDDLILDVMKSLSEKIRADVAKSLETDNPLSVIWNLGSSATSFSIEMSALALRSSKMAQAINGYTIEFRDLFSGILEAYLDEVGATPKYHPNAIVSVIQTLSQGLSLGKGLGGKDNLLEIETASKELINVLCGIEGTGIWRMAAD